MVARLSVAVVLAACAAFVAVRAEPPGPYLRLGSGWSWSEDAGDTPMIDGGIGYRFSPRLRADATAGYRGGYEPDATSLAAMFNAYADITEIGFVTPWGGHGTVAPYVGGGAGAARNEAGNDAETGFAWQASAGIGVQALRGLTIDLGYRFVDLGDRPGRADLRAHEAQIGLRYGF